MGLAKVVRMRGFDHCVQIAAFRLTPAGAGANVSAFTRMAARFMKPRNRSRLFIAAIVAWWPGALTLTHAQKYVQE